VGVAQAVGVLARENGLDEGVVAEAPVGEPGHHWLVLVVNLVHMGTAYTTETAEHDQ
jgi:hypothetical protein